MAVALEELRADPLDGVAFTLQDILDLQEVARSGVGRRAVEDYWRDVCQPLRDERRVDPADGLPFTLPEFCRKYRSQFTEAQCRDYFRSVMARPCPAPRALAPAVGSRGRGTATGGGTVVAVPFAAAARWAAGLEEVTRSEGDLNGSPWALISALRYALHNLRLAIGSIEPREAARHWPALLGLRRASSVLDAFCQRPSEEGFTLCLSSVKAVLEGFREWLREQGSAEVVVPSGVGVSILPGGHSRTVAKSASEATVRLSNGADMPLVGFGTWQMLGEEAYQATLTALNVGYRHVDTAQLYQNEREVGRALRASGVARGDVFLSTKLSDPSCFWRPRPTVEAQLRDLGTDYVDLYMLHQPASPDALRAAWRELEALHAEGKLRALGVSNFGLAELRDLLSFAKVPPVYIQNKLSIYATGEQRVSRGESVMAFARQNGINFFGYSVINPWPGVLKPLEDPHVLAVARRCARTPAQVLLRWALQLGAGVLPKSVSRPRITENFQLFDFELADSDMRLLTGLVTLAEGSPGAVVPSWVEDSYGLGAMPSW